MHRCRVWLGRSNGREFWFQCDLGHVVKGWLYAQLVPGQAGHVEFQAMLTELWQRHRMESSPSGKAGEATS